MIGFFDDKVIILMDNNLNFLVLDKTHSNVNETNDAEKLSVNRNYSRATTPDGVIANIPTTTRRPSYDDRTIHVQWRGDWRILCTNAAMILIRLARSFAPNTISICNISR